MTSRNKTSASIEENFYQILDVTNTTVIGFFDTYLKAEDSNWLDKIKSKGNIN